MLDRAKFWWNSLSRGVRELYDAAGWVGLVVLVLGVVAGIAVPLVFSLSPWLTAVVLLGLFIVVIAEGAYHVWSKTGQQRDTALGERDATKAEIEHRFAALRYALQINDLDPRYFITGPEIMDVQIGLKIKNTSTEYIRYEIENVSTVIAGRRGEGELTGSKTAVIPPNGIDTLTPPAASGVPLGWELGSMSLTIIYGPASGPPRYRRRWEFAVQALRQAGSPQSEISTINMAPVNTPEVEDL